MQGVKPPQADHSLPINADNLNQTHQQVFYQAGLINAAGTFTNPGPSPI